MEVVRDDMMKVHVLIEQRVSWKYCLIRLPKLFQPCFCMLRWQAQHLVEIAQFTDLFEESLRVHIGIGLQVAHGCITEVKSQRKPAFPEHSVQRGISIIGFDSRYTLNHWARICTAGGPRIFHDVLRWDLGMGSAGDCLMQG